MWHIFKIKQYWLVIKLVEFSDYNANTHTVAKSTCPVIVNEKKPLTGKIILVIIYSSHVATVISTCVVEVCNCTNICRCDMFIKKNLHVKDGRCTWTDDSCISDCIHIFHFF